MSTVGAGTITCPGQGFVLSDQLPRDQNPPFTGSSQRWLVLLTSAMDERKDLSMVILVVLKRAGVFRVLRTPCF